MYQKSKRTWLDGYLLGFTLVELLVVISIIALLLSILMPSLNAARERAKRIVCASNLHNLGLAFIMYAHDYKNCMPGNLQSNYWATETGWYPKYISQSASLYCPSNFSHGTGGVYGPMTADISKRIWRDITVGSVSNYATSRALGTGVRSDGFAYCPEKELKLKRIGNKTDVRKDWAGNYRYVEPLAWDYFRLPYELYGLPMGWNHKDKGVNAVFDDGHAEWRSKDDMLKVKPTIVPVHW